MTGRALSVIVPTRNRADAVVRLLQALARQEPVEGGHEVIVVADGCTDGTTARVGSTRWDFDVHILDLAPSGPALARNCGAALARGGVLLFLDDDVEPAAGTLKAHLELHRSHSRHVGVGYLPPVASGPGLFPITLRGWWESMFDGPRRPGHRYSYRNLLSGHFSISRAEFESLSGFNAELSCHEDWEFGYRVIQAGLQLTFVPAAIAWHHDDTDLSKSLQRKFDEGAADVRLAQLHPELTRSLPLGWTGRARVDRSRLVQIAWDYPGVGDRLFRLLVGILPIYERWRLRFRWRTLMERALTYWYWRGVAHAAGTRRKLTALLEAAPSPREPDVVIDLADGLATACARVEDRRPRSARVVYRSRLIGDIPDEPGSEPLRPAHVREALAGTLASRLAWALAEERVLPGVLAARLREQVAAPGSTVAGSAEAFAA